MKMPFGDEWGQDPSVQSMRRIFSFMEEAQHELLKHLNIPLFDKRLRRSREKALELFERAWPQAVQHGIIGNEKEAAPLYIHCLARALNSAGIEVTKEWLPMNEKIIHFLMENLT